MPVTTEISFDLAALRASYQRDALRVTEVIEQAQRRYHAVADNPVWIARRAPEALHADAALLDALAPEQRVKLPLFGIPFAVKDNIDVAGMPTTAGCEAYAYTPTRSATVVERLQAVGAVLVGKTNLDQFAAGLNGTRSPYGICHNAFDARYVAGGSSSGSAVAVATGQVSFALGTDTAGSGRVPASFNNLVGLKPTRGLLSTRGLVPACRSLDCISIFTLTCSDAIAVAQVARAADPEDDFSRVDDVQVQKSTHTFRFGVPPPEQLDFHGDTAAAGLFAQAVERLRAIGGEAVAVDIAPFLETARLLYDGPWLVERQMALGDFFNKHPEALHPVTREVLGGAGQYSAADVFAGLYRLEHFRRATHAKWRDMDMLMLPTAPTVPTIEAVLADPIRLNAKLGHYTNFVNLLDLSALAVPAGFRADGLPWGVTLVAPALHDDWLCRIGARYQGVRPAKLGATGHTLSEQALAVPTANAALVQVAVVGAHLTGQPLNAQLVERGARLVKSCRTANGYRLYALTGTVPPKPGLVYHPNSDSSGIEVEVWEMPVTQFGSFVALIPAPLGIGTLLLDDGTSVKGFMCEAHAARNARDITDFGGWRGYLASLSAKT